MCTVRNLRCRQVIDVGTCFALKYDCIVVVVVAAAAANVVVADGGGVFESLYPSSTDFDVTIGQCVVSDRKLTCAILMRHTKQQHCPTLTSKSVCSHSN